MATEVVPLGGVRVADVTSSPAGIYCTEILGALGVDVIKVDHPRARGRRNPTGVARSRRKVERVTDVRALLRRTAEVAADFLDTLDDRPVFPRASVDELREALGGPLPDGPTDPEQVIEQLVDAAEPGVVAMPSGRYFGFVIGGGLPAALAADWLTSAWDQNAGLYVGGPSASVVEQVVREWVCDLLGLPGTASIGFVTGTQMGSVTALAAARFRVLEQAGWDVGQAGLAGAPRVSVVVGEKRHVTIDRALRLLGLGAPEIVPADSQGRIDVGFLRKTLAAGAGPTIVCAQAGEVNTGAFDSFEEIAAAAEEHGAWLHVDGAFGLWAAASPRLRPLVRGVERADSWITDAHKWLNVPYDSALVLCADPEAHRAAMTISASYLIQDDSRAVRDQVDWVPEFSRRARGFAVYAALRSLGRSGLAELVERSSACAQRFADGIVGIPGVELLNDVVLNQVLFRFESDQRTDEVLRKVQEAGDVWMSGTTWDGRRAIRISVSNWQTQNKEIDLALESFRVAAQEPAQAPAR
jgi:glutamate/tyrosine decarboxylase-like PLP-dependent enzyme